jgi:2-succinyl-5-enolpyruvyl-6-hydroxy-3-cyclohexene-1-carboxylate synthase
VLYAGDLALLHDAGSFVALRKLDAPLVVVGVNNDGGGIFHFLPVRARTERFEELFGTPHGLGLGPLAALGGLDHVLFDAGAPEVGAAVAAALASGRSTLVELRSDREANVEQHRRAYERLVAAVP